MAKKTTKKKSSKKTTRKKAAGKSGGKGRWTANPKQAEGKHLVIVESPTKAKTINKYLGPDYFVMASVGHIRDLPPRNPKGVKRPVPGVDLDNDFEPDYEVMADSKKTVSELRQAAKLAEDVWFATDLDREGEAIAWHVAHALKYPVKDAKRVVFNAITKKAIEEAFSHPRPLETNRVDAQQARRILDRIVGYQVSPLLWKKVAGGLSAGRVQSVATRLVVEREREIEAFIPDEYWRIGGIFATNTDDAAKLAQQWHDFFYVGEDENDKTVKEQNAWLSERACLR
ncbi:MAG: DNA topoisomerase, partial [Planctomycetota bacterium]